MAEKYIILLRGINVSGRNKILMVDLKALVESLGYNSVTTYLQSGNVVFEAPFKLNLKKAAQNMEAAIRETFGYEVPVLILPAAELNPIMTNNPFIAEEQLDPSTCYYTFLFKIPSPGKVKALVAPAKEPGRFKVAESGIFVHCPNGYGKTKIHNQFFETKLKTPATTRNWKTITALQKLTQ